MPSPSRLVFGSPAANRILAADRAQLDDRGNRNRSRTRCHELIRQHGGLEAATRAVRTQLRRPRDGSPADDIHHELLWIDLQTLLALQRSRNQALRRAAAKRRPR